ncbi:carbohydrate kinase [Streptomyces chitinivorans]|uniref:Carbohydrate kinase n=1 Tax=Streptomyces chitinivorans TaxID=1257027 RepID=A0ABW7HYH3_9ACTN|nr:carbohydrate kinase [Streptomyces chitinivorans]MDH2409910.1 carbohydrate kinase [Streptomyces chitinivorans]
MPTPVPEPTASEPAASEPAASEPTAPAPAAAPPVAVLGECVADAFTVPAPRGRERPSAPSIGLEVLPGGGPANTAVALARLGTPTRFLGRLSRDVFGRLFREHLAASGVDLAAAVEAAEPSTLAVADVDAAGRAEYSFHAEGTADWQWTDDGLERAASGPAACLHTGSLALVRPPGGEAVERLLERMRGRATVSIDPNVRPLLVEPAVYRERLPRWCAAADILRLSDDDLGHLLPGAGVEEAAAVLHGHGAALVVVTLGAHGAYASLEGAGGAERVRLRVPAEPTAVVDTVGAGDAFTGGLLHSLHTAGALGGRLDGLTAGTLEQALATGAAVAAATCAVRGADPPRAHRTGRRTRG